jgi:putative SOS response-associated peptidase YedK
MCGRYTLASSADELIETFGVPELSFEHRPRYNIAPGQQALIVAEDDRGRRMGSMRWGLVPSWADAIGRGLVNARGESVGKTPSFREAFGARRCVVPADGFYEWSAASEGRVPHWFCSVDGGLLSMAGIWERWARPGHAPYHGFAIVTVAANGDVAGVHGRMPLILSKAGTEVWLDRSSTPDRVKGLIDPLPSGTLVGQPVSRRVNRTSEDDPGLIERAKDLDS